MSALDSGAVHPQKNFSYYQSTWPAAREKFQNFSYYQPGPGAEKNSISYQTEILEFYSFINLARARRKILWQKDFLLKRPVALYETFTIP